MPIFTALSTFEKTSLEKDGNCTFCNRFHESGAVVLWKIYKGQFNICRVILCDERCHQEYDWQFWENRRTERNVLKGIKKERIFCEV